MMYVRPGNLFKEFIIESNRQVVTSTGRVANDHIGDGTRILKGVLRRPLMRTGKTTARQIMLLPIRLYRREVHRQRGQISWYLRIVCFTS